MNTQCIRFDCEVCGSSEIMEISNVAGPLTHTCTNCGDVTVSDPDWLLEDGIGDEIIFP